MPVKTISPTKRIRTLKPRRQTKPRVPKRSNGAQPLSAKAYVRAVKKALAEGAYLRARAVSAEGASKFPQDAQLARYALVLAPPRVIRTEYAPDTTIAQDKNWIKQNGDRYRGKWIALRNGELLGATDTLQELIDALGKNRDILYTKIF